MVGKLLETMHCMREWRVNIPSRDPGTAHVAPEPRNRKKLLRGGGDGGSYCRGCTPVLAILGCLTPFENTVLRSWDGWQIVGNHAWHAGVACKHSLAGPGHRPCGPRTKNSEKLHHGGGGGIPQRGSRTAHVPPETRNREKLHGKGGWPNRKPHRLAHRPLMLAKI